jgi:protein-disulfide isomerase
MFRNASIVLASVSLLALAACGVDTTGLSPESSRTATGNVSSGIIFTEYADMQCPACQAAYDLINKPLLAKYGSKVRFEFKHFPLKNIHRYAFEAAQASECAADQGKFWEFIDLAYAKQKSLSSTALREWATELKLDGALFDRCVSSGIKEKVVNDDFAQGSKIGVDSTPSFFVNGKRVRNTLEATSAAIDEALQQQSSIPL